MKSPLGNGRIKTKNSKIHSNLPCISEKSSEDHKKKPECDVVVNRKKGINNELAMSYFKAISFCKDLRDFVSQPELCSKTSNLFGFKEECISYDFEPTYFPSKSSKYASLILDACYLGVQEALSLPTNISGYSIKSKFVVMISFEHVDLFSNTIEATLKMQSTSSSELSKTLSEWSECNFDIETWLSGQIIGGRFQFMPNHINAERDRKGWVSFVSSYSL